MRRLTAILVLPLVLMGPLPIRSQIVDPPEGPLSEEAAAQLRRAVGNADPGVVARLAHSLAPSDILAAIYRGGREQRIIAVEAAGYLEDPWPMIPYLVALMTAGERQLASRSAGALVMAMERSVSRPPDGVRQPQARVRQLAGALEMVALDDRLALDIRCAALRVIGLLSHLSGVKIEPPAPLFDDPEEALRGAALALLEPPLEEDVLGRLVKLAKGETDPVLRGQAARLLCENALAHGVEAPSSDLEKVLIQVVESAKGPNETLSLLGCLARFPPEGRASIVDAAMKHQDPSIGKYWEGLKD